MVVQTSVYVVFVVCIFSINPVSLLMATAHEMLYINFQPNQFVIDNSEQLLLLASRVNIFKILQISSRNPTFRTKGANAMISLKKTWYRTT